MKGAGLAVMDLNGTSDPYVQAFTDPPLLINESASTLKSSVIYKDLNPDWKDESITIVLNGSDVEGMKRNGHLFLCVWDEDTFVRDMSLDHDLIGLVSISFTDILNAVKSGKPLSLTETLMSNGYRNGTLTFTITGTLPAVTDMVSQTSTIGSELPRPTGCLPAGSCILS